jgi:hypothetical protein
MNDSDNNMSGNEKIAILRPDTKSVSPLGELISAEQIAARDYITQKGKQTMLGFFDKGIFFCHAIGGETNKLKLSYENSVRVRYEVQRRLIPLNSKDTPITNRHIGDCFSHICEDDDSFILRGLKDGKSTQDLQEELLKLAKRYFNL